LSRSSSPRAESVSAWWRSTRLTAESVRNDIIEALQLRSPRVTITGYDRKNLYIHASRRTTSVNQIHAYKLDLQPLLQEDGRGRMSFGGPTIVYCQTR